MRLGKWFVLSVLLVLALASGVMAQPVSTVDFLFMVPSSIEIDTVPTTDSSFTWAVWINNTTPLMGIQLPLCYGGSADLKLNYAVLSGTDIRGVTYGPAGRSLSWAVKTSLIDTLGKDILCGLLSFGSPLPPTNDTLLYLHFQLAANAADAVVHCDTCESASQHVSIVDEPAVERRPTWTKGDLSMGTAVDRPGSGITPLVYGLDQNLPNPFNAQTRINFSMPAAGHVKLIVYNVLGQEVVTLLDGKLDANKHEIVWDGNNGQGTPVASGTYFYRLNIDGAFEETRQMTMLK